jgi:hypothetical protein
MIARGKVVSGATWDEMRSIYSSLGTYLNSCAEQCDLLIPRNVTSESPCYVMRHH